MAVNKSRKGGGVNSFDDDEFGLAELGRLSEQYDREPAAFRELRLRASRANTTVEAINSMEAQVPGSTSLPLFQKQLLAAQRTQAQLAPRMSLYKESQRERLNAQAVNTIGREFSESSVNSYVSESMNSSGMQAAGLNMAGRYDYASLVSQRKDVLNEIAGVRQNALNTAGSFIRGHGVDPGAAAGLQEGSTKMRDLAKELTEITAGLAQLKRDGMDPQSRMLALTKAGENAKGVLGFNALEDQMRSGQGLGALSPRELKLKEAEAAQKLMKAMDDLRNSMDKGEASVEKLTKQAEEAAQELNDVQEAQKMGGNGDGYQKAQIVTGALAEAMRVIGDTVQTLGITQPLQQVQNVQGAANIENEKYDMWRAAVGGDMTARMNLGGWSNAQAFGDTLADRTRWVHGARLVGNGLSAAGGVIQMAEAGAQVANPGSSIAGVSHTQQFWQGAQNTMSGVAGGLTEGADWLREISKTQNRLAGIHSSMGATKALNHISGFQFQQYRDYIMGLNEASNEMGGSNGESFLQNTSGAGFMAQMMQSGVGIKEMGQLSSSGAAALGSMFNANQVLGAVNLENAGFGSAADNMHRMAMLGAGGTQDPSANLQKLIEEGMVKGLTSSRALNIIAENTGKMTEQFTASGSYADPTDAISRIVLNAMDRNNPNKEMAAQTAYSTFQSEEMYRHNTSASFSGQIAVARLQKDLGTDLRTAATINGIPTGMLNSWRGLSRDRQIAEFANRGVDVTGMAAFNNGSLFDILGRDQSLSEIERAGPGFATGAADGWTKIRDWLRKDPANARNWIQGGVAMNSAPDFVKSQYLRLNEAITRQNPNANPQAIRGNILSADFFDGLDSGNIAGGPARTLLQEEKRRRNRQEVQAGMMTFDADSGLTGGSKEGMMGIAAVAESGRVAFEKAGENAEKTWSDAASKTAMAFGKSATLMSGAASKLDKVADRLIVGTDAFKAVVDKLEAAEKATKKFEENIPANVRARLDKAATPY